VPETSSADDAFLIAAQLEDLGQAFYETLAGCVDSRPIATLCTRLAGDEARHGRTFRAMREEYLASGRIGSLADGAGVAEARKQLRRTVLPGPEKVAALVAGNRTAELLEMAVGMEDAAVALYERLKVDLPDTESAALDRILDEERRHQAILRDTRDRLS